jgi:flavin reductase (DIM6/NTAB) family NADH-FMN oxidoreductase RutF
MKFFNQVDLEAMEQRFRTTFINSIAGFKSLNLVGTVDESGKTNLAIFNSIFHVGANPPYLGMVVRPPEVDRHTLQNILDTNVYTLNHVNPQILEASHQTSARYPKEVSEFSSCGLTPKFTQQIIAPYVEESHVKIGLKLVEKIDIKVNRTVIIIGEITEIIIDEKAIQQDGFVDLQMLESITVSGLDAYYKTILLNRFSYAKP